MAAKTVRSYGMVFHGRSSRFRTIIFSLDLQLFYFSVVFRVTVPCRMWHFFAAVTRHGAGVVARLGSAVLSNRADINRCEI